MLFEKKVAINKKKISLWIAVLGVLCSGRVQAGPLVGLDSLPPVGDRVYLIDKKGKNRYSGVRVTKAANAQVAGGIQVLRDPDLGLGYAGEESAAKEKQQLISDKSVYELAPLTVRAAFQKPEVPFKDVEIIINRADQPIPGNFLHKISKDLPDL